MPVLKPVPAPAPLPVLASTPIIVARDPVQVDPVPVMEAAGSPPKPPKAAPLDAEQLRKADLARMLLDLMAASSTGLPQERALAADTLLELLPQLRGPILVTLSERIAMMEAPAAALVTGLATATDPSVSGPILEEGLHVPDEDLLAVIARGPGEGLRFIARRRKLSRTVTEAIARSGDQSAILTLIRNQGAEISGAGFEVLMEIAKSKADLLAPLCTRADLPSHLALELFWAAPAQLRRFLMSRFLADSETLQALLKIKLDVSSHAAFQTPEKETVIAALGSLIGSDPKAGYQAVAQCARVSPKTIARIVSDNQGEAIVVLFKVMGIPRSEVPGLLQEFASGEKPLIDPARSLDDLQTVFDQLSFNKARLLLTYWDWAATGVGPYAKKR